MPSLAGGCLSFPRRRAFPGGAGQRIREDHLFGLHRVARICVISLRLRCCDVPSRAAGPPWGSPERWQRRAGGGMARSWARGGALHPVSSLETNLSAVSHLETSRERGMSWKSGTEQV